MTGTGRQLVVGMMMTGLIGTGRPVVAASVDGSAIGRVRSSNAVIGRVLEEASDRSRTFRRLVETINASDGTVYVEEGKCGYGVRACLVTVTTRHLMVGALMTTLAGGGRAAVAAGVDTPAMPRARSHHTGIASLIERAAKRSKTFRDLVEAINTSNGIVYVEEGQCGRHVVKSCVAAVTQTTTNRILVVKVDIRNADGELMGLIGHELRHAIEILGEPNVVDAVSMYFLYQRIGRLGTYTAFETQAAVQAGNAVRAEVSK